MALLACEIHKSAKASDKCRTHLCVLVCNYGEPTYVKFAEDPCAEHRINLINTDDNKKLGDLVGLGNTDRENPVKWLVIVV